MSVRDSIVIVGNGPVPDSAAPAIAGAGLVIRFNDCRSFRAGERTDIVAVCNTGRPAGAMIGTGSWALHPAVHAAGAIWCVRDPATFAALRAPLSIIHPELDDFCDDLTVEFEAFARRTGKTFRIIGGDVHASADAVLAPFEPAPYVVPSSGMIVIADVLSRFPGADIALAGFGHVGWGGHPFAAERQLVDLYETEGRLRRIDAIASSANAALPRTQTFSEVRR